MHGGAVEPAPIVRLGQHLLLMGYEKIGARLGLTHRMVVRVFFKDKLPSWDGCAVFCDQFA
jgi:hypothetical protein